MSKPTQLMRTCVACGNEKPLAAFLQITGAQGTTYGSVCSTCRGATAKTKTTIFLNEDDRGGGSSGVRIDATARNTAEMLQEKEKKDKKLDAKENAVKRDERDLEKKSATELKTSKERDRRSFLESKKQSFLRFQDKKAAQPELAKQALETKIRDQQHHEVIDSEKLSENIKQEARTTNIDLTVPFMDPQFALIKFNSPIFLEFKSWLRSGAPIMRVFDQLFKKQLGETKQQSLFADKDTSIFKKHTVETKSPALQKGEPLTEYSHKAWGPSRKL